MNATIPKALKALKDYPRREAVFALQAVPDSRRLVFGGSDFQVYEIDLAQEKPEARAWGGHESYVTGIALAGPWAVSGGYDGRLIWWDLATGAKARTVDAHAKWIRRVLATSDGKVIASVADDMLCRLWDAETGAPLRTLRGHAEMTPHHYPSMLHACMISADGQYVATGDKVGHVIVWELATGKSLATLEAPALYTWDPVQRRHSIGGIRALAFAPDGSSLAVGGIDQIGNIDHLEGKARIEVFDWRKGERTQSFVSDKIKGMVQQLVFPPQGDWLLAAGGANDGFLMVLDLKTKSFALQDKARTHLHAIALTPSTGTLVAAAHGRIQVYEIQD